MWRQTSLLSESQFPHKKSEAYSRTYPKGLCGLQNGRVRKHAEHRVGAQEMVATLQLTLESKAGGMGKGQREGGGEHGNLTEKDVNSLGFADNLP